jgi:hypothetical protein
MHAELWQAHLEHSTANDQWANFLNPSFRRNDDKIPGRFSLEDIKWAIEVNRQHRREAKKARLRPWCDAMRASDVPEWHAVHHIWQ